MIAERVGSMLPRRRWRMSLYAFSAIGVIATILLIAKFTGIRNGNYRTTKVVGRSFKKVLRRIGSIKPVDEHQVFPKISGTILEIVEQGKMVVKDEVILRLDPAPLEDNKIAKETQIDMLQFAFRKKQEESKKVLKQAQEDKASFALRERLETARLEELEKGASEIDRVKAQTNVENSRNILAALQEELKALQALGAAGGASGSEIRQKELDTTEQRLRLEGAEIAIRKLNCLDQVQIAEQQLKVQDTVKMRIAAMDRVALLERNMQRDIALHSSNLEIENQKLADIVDKIKKTIYTASKPGLVIHMSGRWWNYGPGRDVWAGLAVLSLTDLSKLKVNFSVDQNRIASVSLNQMATVIPAGWRGEPFRGKVSKISKHGHDEFEYLKGDTTAISGTADRQVFDVEVEIEGQSSCLRPGLRATVDILLQDLENVLVIPRTAIFQENGIAVARVDTLYGTEIRKIRVVAEDNLYAVTEGLKEGEYVQIVEEP